MRVRVYYNLKRAVWSIKAMEGAFKGKVIGYAHSVLLRDAHTVVSEASRQRVLRERRKNVHAYIDGQLTHAHKYEGRLMTPQIERRGIERVHLIRPMYYNPYRVSHFVWHDTGESTEGQVLSEVYLRGDRKVQAVPPQ